MLAPSPVVSSCRLLFISALVKIIIVTEFITFWEKTLKHLNIFILSTVADGRLSSGHAGVLLAERRGSYPLIDLRILKSKFSQ